jgi:hypothetical protein
MRTRNPVAGRDASAEAVMDNVAAGIEHVGELLTRPQPAQRDLAAIQRAGPLGAVAEPGRADHRAAGEGEVVQLAGECAAGDSPLRCTRAGPTW